MKFVESTAAEIERVRKDEVVVIAPIAACEQHSTHLPVFTDSILCGAIADRVEAALPESTLLLPVLWLGASEHHLPFGGTLTATLPTYEQVLVELLAPMLESGFRRMFFLNGHGGNVDPFRAALRRLDVRFPRAILTGAAYWHIAEKELAALCRGPLKTVGHACEIETAMMLHLRPELVRSDRIVDDPDMNPAALSGLTWARDFGRKTDHGAVGFPSFATAATGKAMFESVVARVSAVVSAIREELE